MSEAKVILPGVAEHTLTGAFEVVAHGAVVGRVELRFGELLGEGARAKVYVVESTSNLPSQWDAAGPGGAGLVAKVFDERCNHDAMHEAKMLTASAGNHNIVGFYGIGLRQTVPKRLTFENADISVEVLDLRQILSQPASVQVPDAGTHLLLQERCESNFQEFAENFKVTEEYAAFVMRGVFQGLAHMHHRGVLHRDIKPENVLLADNGRRVCLGDFGFAVQPTSIDISAAVEWRCGTPGYAAPEVVQQKRGNAQSDVFSAGVLFFFAMSSGQLPWRGPETEGLEPPSYQTIARATVRCKPNTHSDGPLSGRSSHGRALVRQLLELQPSRRPSAQECVQNAWLRKRAKLGATCDLASVLRKKTIAVGEKCDAAREESEPEEDEGLSGPKPPVDRITSLGSVIQDSNMRKREAAHQAPTLASQQRDEEEKHQIETPTAPLPVGRLTTVESVDGTGSALVETFDACLPQAARVLPPTGRATTVPNAAQVLPPTGRATTEPPKGPTISGFFTQARRQLVQLVSRQKANEVVTF